ncbi:MAG: rok family protein [Rhodobacteraceae bacterium]|uniref:ROK family transcriptional regulator n=1 Tax=Cypionkella sp. TaxID=2811411 RepID=UPI0013217243|nr:ROK family transcriptional regulator [Cypionkella sp.]KAF0175344.1 MAG: rok family protein [Paracoccaceae bacterium]MDO8325837.1 ROK family transcriptional regulator [Cypionkella sp.]
MPLGAEIQTDRSSEDLGLRGSNQSGMRDHNERLVLSLVRQQGGLAKSDIARITGLSAQTVSVIMRALEQDGLLLRGEPVRGRIGQPSIPMFLNPEGAFFLGLKIGRRSADLTLVDFLGRVRATRRQVYRYPSPSAVVAFVARALPDLTASLGAAERTRISGMGVAMPFQLWSWVQLIGAPQSEMDAWRDHDIQGDLAAITGLPVYVQNDATSACGAELVFGTGDKPKDFLYFYFGYFIGGGLVLNGQLMLGRSGNAAGVGPLPVPGRDGKMNRLISVASMSTLATAMAAAGESSDHLWEQHGRWIVSERILSEWMDQAANGLAWAALSAASLLEIEAVMIDGWMPTEIRAEITRRTHAALHALDLDGIDPPMIREGTLGAQARALGAAAIPLSQRYLIDQNAAGRET